MASTEHGTPEPSEPSSEPSPPDELPWLFKKGNTFGKWRRKPRRMERFIRKITKDDDIICAFFLAVAAGHPIPAREVRPTSRTRWRWGSSSWRTR